METALAIAAVTAVLRYVIEEGMARNRVGALIDRAIVGPRFLPTASHRWDRTLFKSICFFIESASTPR
jgi:hypothetical protein